MLIKLVEHAVWKNKVFLCFLPFAAQFHIVAVVFSDAGLAVSGGSNAEKGRSDRNEANQSEVAAGAVSAAIRTELCSTNEILTDEIGPFLKG